MTMQRVGEKNKCAVALLMLVLSLSFSERIFAHEETYHVDPPITEHAHMEYEAVFGNAFLKGQDVDGARQDLLMWEVEGNLPFFPWFSMETVLSFGTPTTGDSGLAFGDLELEPRFILDDSKKWVLNLGVPFLFPTGNATKGLGEDLWAAEPTIRLDLFLPDTDIYSNTTVGVGLNREEIDFTQSAAMVYLWRVSPEVTLSPVAELTGTVSKNEEDSFSGAAGFGAAFKEWFVLAEIEAPFVRGGEPAWSLLFHAGYHRVKRNGHEQ